MWARKVKRLIDVTACLITLPVVLVVCGAVALAIWLTMGRPVLFRQKRAGLYGGAGLPLQFGDVVVNRPWCRAVQGRERGCASRRQRAERA